MLCVIRSMSDVELPMCFESAHSVPKLFKFWHFVTSSLIAYDGPRGPSQATRLSQHKNVVSCTKSFFANGIQTKGRPKKVMQLQGAHLRGRF